MLAQYRTDTTALLQLPAAPTSLYPQANIDRWINIARGQLAGEGECIRYLATISTVVGQRNYNFSALNTGTAATNGIKGAIHIRRISYNVGDGQKWLTPRPWEWFELYHLNNPVPVNNVPGTWSQFGQGSASAGTGSSASGSFYLDPPPNLVYTLNCDCVCYPQALVDDATIEAIPYLWTDAVPFFAAYYALLSAQTNARQADAQRYFDMYTEFLTRARKASNPSVLRWQYEQAGDPAQGNKIASQQQRGAAG